MLARASTRAREMSIRTALGAGRVQILRQLLTESVIVGLFSVPLGMLFAKAGLTLMDMSIPPDDIPYFIHWSLNVRALLYATAVAALTGIVFGLAPALEASRPGLVPALKGGDATPGERRSRFDLKKILVVGEVALSLLLLIGASLFTRSFLQMKQANGGFDAKPLMTLRSYMPNEIYTTPELKVQRIEDVVRRVEALPGVQAAFASNLVPLDGGGDERAVVIDGHPTEKGREPAIEFIGVSPHMLKTLGLTLRRGRELTETESFARAPYAVINEAMAKKFFPAGDALGKQIRNLGMDSHKQIPMTIVGIVADVRSADLARPPGPQQFVPYRQRPERAHYGVLLVRTKVPPATLASVARSQLRLIDSNVLMTIEVASDIRSRSLADRRFTMSVLGGFALLGLTLAAIGIYGVLSLAVAQRRRELGIRMALGAERGGVLAMILAQAMSIAAVGGVLGGVGAVLAGRALGSMLYGVTAADPVTYGELVCVLAAAVLAAGIVPAARATRVSPMVALRSE